MKKLLMLGITVFLISAAGSAQQPRNNRAQNLRIERGVKSGHLNRVERLQIRKDQFRYNLAQARVRMYGVVTPGERRRLKMMKRKNDCQIFRMKHNGRNRVI